MKICSLIFLFTVNIFTVYAQQDSLAPKWEKGLTWKITSTTLSPNKSLAEDNVIAYDTTVSKFLWEIEAVNDSSVTLSILPLNIKMSSATPDTIDYSEIKEAFETLKNSNTPLIYQTKVNGVIKKLPDYENDSLTVYNAYQNKYFVNDSALMQLFSINNTEEEYDENGELYDYGIGQAKFNILLEFFEKIAETIHSPYGEPYTLDSIVDVKDFTKGKWDSYQNGLGAMAEMMNVTGDYQMKNVNGQLVSHMEIEMDLGIMMRKLAESSDSKGDRKSKKNSKEVKKNLNQLNMTMGFIGNYILNENDHFPVKFNTEIQTNVSTKEEDVSFSAFNELIFE